jgi:hypothetical protein
VNTPDSSHRDGLENSNFCRFGNIQTLAQVFLPVACTRTKQKLHPDVQPFGTMTYAGKKGAREFHSIQKRQVAAISDRNSNGGTFASGGRIGCGRLPVARDGSRVGISVVLVARRLSLLLL